MKKIIPSVLTASCLLTGLITSSANAGVTLLDNNGWKAEISGSIPVFAVMVDEDAPSGGGSGEQGFRIQSGFNPANLTTLVTAPAHNGITVSGRMQIDTHLQGNTQNGGLFEGRIAEIQVDSNAGTFHIGKGFGIFNTGAIGDIGSQGGVGWLGNGVDTANTTGGRIGTGYVYANFNPRLMYTTPESNGFKLKVGLINPEEPNGLSADIETSLPRFEGQLNFARTSDNGGLKVWAGFMHQNVDVVTSNFDYDMLGVDIGGHIDVGMFGLTGNFTVTEGVGADGLYGINTDTGNGLDDAEVDATQWYVEADINTGHTIYGASYGEGEQDAETTPVGSARDITNKLAMLFIHHKLTPELTLVGELQDYQSEAQDDYNAFIVGAQFDY